MERLKQKLNTKWASTIASIWIQCTSGSLYTFSVYSPTLKSTQHYDLSTLDTLSVFKDIGANCGVLSGILYTSATTFTSCGPCLVLLSGAIQCFAGYFLMWAAITALIPRPQPVAVMCLFMFLAAHAQSFFNTANVVTSVRNFRVYSGTAVGIMKGFLGLSGAILIQVYRTFFNNKPTSFLLLLALLPTINSLLLMWFVRIYDTTEGDEKKHLDGFSMISLIIAAYMMIIIILEHIFVLPLWARLLTLVVLLLLLASPVIVAVKAQKRDSQRVSQTCTCERDGLANKPHQLNAGKTRSRKDPDGYHLLPGDDDREIDTHTSDYDTLQWEENLSLLQAVRTVDFWILFLAMACGMGSGLATVNNFSQIGLSLGYSSFETNTLISLWSIWNFLGRFGAGYVSDYFLNTKGWARPLFMVITLATMSIGYVVIATGLPSALYIGSILVGVCYGSQWSLMPTIASEIFGVRHMGTIFNAITIASPAGSYIFSVRVVGYIYDSEASGEGNTCTGTHCFMLSFLIMASATLLGSLAALGLFLRTKRFYNQVVPRRLLHSVRE
ncbi:Nodulin-like domain-containing protein/MFS_1 domain-containing protein [Cephalotus follicularis]|uniref:Nodulin-like domain-containing protein/MFS_1 domain-containing protein n=1 Tax=Cephalotus follicularis TaxID=3775 RepID=A0A1Q3BFF7_CEPFO|nr:Nodulin-like domain-containing protein/MFS_1 domain-containing protein [Cephalotus follicularis]